MFFFAAEQKVEQIFDFCGKERDAAPQIIKRFFFTHSRQIALRGVKKNLESSLILLIYMPPPHPAVRIRTHTLVTPILFRSEKADFFLKKSLPSFLILFF